MALINILVLGAGELGTAVLSSLLQHPSRAHNKASISLLLLLLLLLLLRFIAGPGTQLKIARAVLDAEAPFFIPWQVGVDYDTICRRSAHDLFDEQLDVHDLLKAQKKTSWTAVLTEMFTNFLFDAGFGIVEFGGGDGKNAKVRALGSWENRVTVTAPEDIGKLTAENTFGDDGVVGGNAPVFIGGDTKKVERSVLTTQALEKDHGNALLKYDAFFGAGKGVAWDLEKT
ncbi:hypothetical protein ACO22_01754 [Paracoccidioides brasiliensis]|uniref:NmrA-like domain-containing protein n=1 Tax=Paracoccidioides brasiliensis TaxID=121759 RepID=A0A1D2JKK0_PARBR|nr:hypothetical protein ACO22_01754 [Paracoccidioides brasiliensis]